MSPEEMLDIVTRFPYGVINSPKGFSIYHIVELKKNVCICRLNFDGKRDDPTLISDILMETFDPEKKVDMLFYHFHKFYDTLDNATDAIRAWEKQLGWKREHLVACEEAVKLAKRNLNMAESAIMHSTNLMYGKGYAPMELRLSDY